MRLRRLSIVIESLGKASDTAMFRTSADSSSAVSTNESLRFHNHDSTVPLFLYYNFLPVSSQLSTIKTSLYSDNNNDCKGIAKNTLKHHKEYCFVCFASCEYLIWGCCSESSIRVLPDSHRPKILDFIQVFFICSCKFSTKNRLCEEYMHLFLLFY